LSAELPPAVLWARCSYPEVNVKNSNGLGCAHADEKILKVFSALGLYEASGPKVQSWFSGVSIAAQFRDTSTPLSVQIHAPSHTEFDQ